MDEPQVPAYRDPATLIKQTFEELEIPGFRPLRNTVILRTHPIPVRTGAIFLPVKLTTFYGELPHMQPIVATVIAAGPKATCKVGDRVAFLRLHFALWKRCADDTAIGWIADDGNIIGWVDLDEDEAFADLRVESATARRMSNSG